MQVGVRLKYCVDRHASRAVVGEVDLGGMTGKGNINGPGPNIKQLASFGKRSFYSVRVTA
jgi:hypothetical protein